MKKIALTLAVAAVGFLGVGCTTSGGADKAGVRPATAADGSFDGKYQRRNVGEWADADLVISGDGGSLLTFGSGCHRNGTPIKIVEQTPNTIRFMEDYQGSIVGCANAKILTLKKVMVDGKPALANWAGEVFYIKQ